MKVTDGLKKDSFSGTKVPFTVYSYENKVSLTVAGGSGW